MSETRDVTVLLKADADPQATVRHLKSAGLEGASVLDAVGVVTGTIAAGKLDALKQVAGVQSVDVARSMKIAPPDADVQ